jgi:hypothetical protein
MAMPLLFGRNTMGKRTKRLCLTLSVLLVFILVLPILAGCGPSTDDLNGVDYTPISFGDQELYLGASRDRAGQGLSVKR